MEGISKEQSREMIQGRLREMQGILAGAVDPLEAFDQANQVLFQLLLNITSYLEDDEISEALEEIADTYANIGDLAGVQYQAFYADFDPEDEKEPE